ncbi:hypothetical protein AA105894_1142 [Asaia spathodeae NBRC 105894]|nr:hypothetical protein AA105894_1142 [Asaia spathodeae NBRC 105894]
MAPFARSNFEGFAGILAGVKGRFILSSNDRPEMRETFAAFQIDSFKTSYSVTSCAIGRRRVGEVLISNG